MNLPGKIHLVECPRDAMQGWKHFIPTKQKVEYINALLQVGFDTLDMGSFVSPKAIPQMADTADVIRSINMQDTATKLLVIIANVRGAEEACNFEAVTYLGFPFSVSETFQQRNTNSSIKASLNRLHEIQNICVTHNKQLVVYLSMGFGNPYGDAYSAEIVYEWAGKIADIGVKTISVADTIGIANPEQISNIISCLVKMLPDRQIGVHLHSAPDRWQPKLEAAFRAGCMRFDGALNGIGGCPMADDELVGNLDTGEMIAYFKEFNVLKPLNDDALRRSLELADKIFIS